ncbi:MAG: hypothetical protein F4114_15915 [Rhodospirillaceae bacterium]|nr:hypothetical protein [Rhodospirillaceae bacterium]
MDGDSRLAQHALQQAGQELADAVFLDRHRGEKIGTGEIGDLAALGGRLGLPFSIGAVGRRIVAQIAHVVDETVAVGIGEDAGDRAGVAPLVAAIGRVPPAGGGAQPPLAEAQDLLAVGGAQVEFGLVGPDQADIEAGRRAGGCRRSGSPPARRRSASGRSGSCAG